MHLDRHTFYVVEIPALTIVWKFDNYTTKATTEIINIYRWPTNLSEAIFTASWVSIYKM